MFSQENKHSSVTRRAFLGGGAAAALGAAPVLSGWQARGQSRAHGPATHVFPLDRNWLFGPFSEQSLAENFDDTALSQVLLPHCVAKLSWHKWDTAQWQNVWTYRRHFSLQDAQQGRRTFLHFNRVMAMAAPVFNGHALAEHRGGYLPFSYEITNMLRRKNTLAVKVDSRWLSIPPAGSPKGFAGCDYYLTGGITGPVELQLAPQIFISDVFARPMDVLSASRRLELICTIDATALQSGQFHLEAVLLSGSAKIASTKKNISLEKTGASEFTIFFTALKDVSLWDVNSPHLYETVVTLTRNGKPLHDYRGRTGFREARFDVNGFFLNGRRLRLFGLNRHEIYPYAGYAMPARTMRRDAEILKHEFNVNVVRCSHYPQSPAFLDACDELGLMVWQETPGWGYVGDDQWQEIVVQNVHDMVLRDRSRPSVVIWGVRVNESHNNPALYTRTRDLAKSLDGTRPTSGSMTSTSAKTLETWHQDVFAFDDYHSAPDGSVGLTPPLPGIPYFFSETVGQFNYPAHHGFNQIYRRTGDPAVQQQQAIFHAQAHDRAASFPRCGGAIAWCGFEYPSPMNAYEGIKCPGVADVFRIPKLGASFYRAQVDPAIHAVIEPDFYWDFGPQTPKGPGAHAAIFSNCDRLELFIDGHRHATLYPDKANYPNLKHAPFFADLSVDGTDKPTLRIDGYLGDHLSLSKSFSSDSSHDRLAAALDDHEIAGDGIDATRLSFIVTDRHGALRPFVKGEVSFHVEGPATVLGDNPFGLEDSGGSGAVWIKSHPGGTGTVTILVTHSQFGSQSLRLRIQPAKEAEI